MCQPLTPAGRVYKAGLEEKEDLGPSKDLLYPWYFPLFTHLLPLLPPSSIKGRVGLPTEGGRKKPTFNGQLTYRRTHREFNSTHIHSQAATRLLASFRPFHQRPGTSPSLDRLYPLLRIAFSANNTSSNRLDVETFGTNQYKPCVL